MAQSYNISGQRTAHPGGKPREQSPPWPAQPTKKRNPLRREMMIVMDEAADISPVEWEKMIRQLGRP